MSASRKTRIAYVNHTGNVSGAEKVLMSMLRGIDRARYEPILLCPADGGLAEEAKTVGVPWLPLPAVSARFTKRPDRLLKSLMELWGAVRTLRRSMRALAPDLIHANTVRAGITASLATIGMGGIMIWHVHDALPRHPLSTLIRLFAYLDRRTRVIAVSHATAWRFCGDIPFKGRVRTIHNGTDLTRFPLKRKRQCAFRETLGISEKEFLVCAIGQICARKGLLELLSGFHRISEQAPQMHLVFVGAAVFQHEEKYQESLIAAAAAPGIAGRVHFTGALRDVYPVLEAADLLVLNSREEPFGLVLIEAMSAGTPVLATRVGGVPEIVTDSENGWLVESGDIDALSLKLLQLSRDEAALENAARVARAATCPQFSMERFYERLMKFYADLDRRSDLGWNPYKPPVIAGSSKDQGVHYA